MFHSLMKINILILPSVPEVDTGPPLPLSDINSDVINVDSISTSESSTLTARRGSTQIMEMTSIAKTTNGSTIVKSSSKITSSTDQCPGYKLIFPTGQSPYSFYPFQIHVETSYPWTPRLEGQMMYLQSIRCQGGALNIPCIDCAEVGRHSIVQGILERATYGVKEHTLWKWLPHNQLAEVAG